MTTTKRIIKNTGFLYAKMGITIFINLYITRLILNALGTNDFGVYHIVGGAIAMLGFVNMAMAAATQRFMSYSVGENNIEKQKVIFNVSIILHFILASIIAVLLIVVGYFFFNGILNIPPERIMASQIVYGSLIISTIFTVISVPYDAIMNAHENMKYYALISIFEAFLKLIVAIVVVYASIDKLIVYGILMALIPIFTMNIMRLYCHKKYEECVFNPKSYFNKKQMKEMTSFTGWNMVGAMSNMIGNHGNSIVVNHFWGVTINAALGIVGQLTGQLMSFSYNMMKALNPVIVKAEGASNRKEMLLYSYAGCKFPFFMLSLFAIPFCIETPFILNVWLKHVPEWTILFFRLQMIRTLIELLTFGLTTSISAVGKIKEWNMSNIFTHLFPLVILYILFSFEYPPYWLFIITISFCAIISGVIKILICKKHCDLNILEFIYKVLLPSITCSIATYMIASIPSIFMGEGWFRFIITVSLFIMSFFFIIYKIGLNPNERNIINTFIFKLKQKAFNI